ncbi:MAG: type II toxin-antitoxin system RelB/DinJ family antitoxin [Candidatus Anammoxibacter sp.]
MPKTATIQARINPKVKTQAQKILNSLHISMSEAISIYLTQIALHKGIPFEITIPNELTVKTIKKAEDEKGLHKVNSVDELYRELDG